MEKQFERNKLIFGDDYLEIIKDKKIAIFGLGGVGGNAAEALARFGFSRFYIFDADTVNETNINRQVIATHLTIGEKKIDAMKARLLSINPNIEIVSDDRFLMPEDLKDIHFNNFDYVIDAIDTVKTKIELIRICKENNINIISALGCGNKIEPTMLEVSDLSKTSYDPLAKVLRRELSLLGIKHLKVVYSKEQRESNTLEESKGKHIPGSSPFVPPVAGIIIASEVSKDLLK